MTKKQLTILLAMSMCMISFSIQRASGQTATPQQCIQLEEKTSGDKKKYSINAYVEALVAFDTIDCGIEFRKELCAMDMANFDLSAVVYDFNSGEELLMQKAFFVLKPLQNVARNQIIAFKSEDAAKQFTKKHGGKVVDFDAIAY